MKVNASVAWFLAVSFVASPGFGSPAQAQDGEAEASLFIVEFTTGPAWLPDRPFSEQPDAAGHSANLRRLREEGMLVLGARHGNKGMIIVRGRTEADIRSEIEKDPTIGSGVFAYSIEELRPFYGGCVELPATPGN